MTGTADREGIPLSDPTVPIDPEQAARAILPRRLAALAARPCRSTA